MSADSKAAADVEAVEHLDFAPMCEVSHHSVCQQTNAANYLAASRCCPGALLVCSACVQAKVTMPGGIWQCGFCERIWGRVSWLDLVVLHPLGGAA